MYTKKEQVKTFLQGEVKLGGFMLTGHVCMVMGYEEYEPFPVPRRKYHEKHLPPSLAFIWVGKRISR